MSSSGIVLHNVDIMVKNIGYISTDIANVTYNVFKKQYTIHNSYVKIHYNNHKMRDIYIKHLTTSQSLTNIDIDCDMKIDKLHIVAHIKIYLKISASGKRYLSSVSIDHLLVRGHEFYIDLHGSIVDCRDYYDGTIDLEVTNPALLLHTMYTHQIADSDNIALIERMLGPRVADKQIHIKTVFNQDGVQIDNIFVHSFKNI
jgi:hypothetical protein